jgi:hypothetical protein
MSKKREKMSLTENTEAQSLGKNLKTEDRTSCIEKKVPGKKEREGNDN